MLGVSESIGSKSGHRHGGAVALADQPARETRKLARSEILFFAGQPRTTVYRVESGAICHYIIWKDGRHDVIECAFPGDLIGFGHLAKHVSTAQALVDTVLSEVTLEEFDDVVERDGQLSARVSAAADREFAALRERTVPPVSAIPLDHDKVVSQLAALIVALSQLNARDGSDPTLIVDDLTAALADRLDMTPEAVGGALEALERQGLITPNDDGRRRVRDFARLEALAG